MIHLLSGAGVDFHVGPSGQTVPFGVEEEDLVLDVGVELHPEEHPPVGVGGGCTVHSSSPWLLGGAPFLVGLTMALVEGVQGGVGEEVCGVGVDEGEVNGVVSDPFVLVGIGELELEDNGVVFGIGGKGEGLKEAFGVLGSECEPQEECCEARADDEACAARAAVPPLIPRHPTAYTSGATVSKKDDR